MQGLVNKTKWAYAMKLAYFVKAIQLCYTEFQFFSYLFSFSGNFQGTWDQELILCNWHGDPCSKCSKPFSLMDRRIDKEDIQELLLKLLELWIESVALKGYRTPIPLHHIVILI